MYESAQNKVWRIVIIIYQLFFLQCYDYRFIILVSFCPDHVLMDTANVYWLVFSVILTVIRFLANQSF